MRRLLAGFSSWLLMFCLLLTSACPTLAEYRSLSAGDKGKDVTELKKRLHYH